jgi:hypothetical protein
VKLTLAGLFASGKPAQRAAKFANLPHATQHGETAPLP